MNTGPITGAFAGRSRLFLLAALVALPATAHRIRHRFDPDRKPAEVYLSPDPDPPRP